MSRFKINILFLPLLMLLCGITGGVTYAFWSGIVKVDANVLTSGELSFTVNGADGEEVVGVPLAVRGLIPSDSLSIEKAIVIRNTGTMGIKYRISFQSVQDEDDLLYFTRVSFDNGESWMPLIYAQYLEIMHPLSANDAIAIPVLFRLDEDFSAFYRPNMIASFKIIVKAVQYEDTLDSQLIYINKIPQATHPFGFIQFKNFNPGNHEEITINDDQYDFERDNQFVFGDWEGRNTFRIIYNEKTKTITLYVNGLSYQYTFTEPNSISSLEITLYCKNNNSQLRITDFTVNNLQIKEYFVSSRDGNNWSISGNLLVQNGILDISGILEVSGNHPSKDHSLLEFRLIK